MKKSTKRFYSLLLTAVMLLALTACGTGGDGGVPASPSGGAKTGRCRKGLHTNPSLYILTAPKTHY